MKKNLHNASFKKYLNIRNNFKTNKKYKELGYLLNTCISFIAYNRINVQTIGYNTLLSRFRNSYMYDNIEEFFNQELFVSSVSNRLNYVQLIKNTIAHYNNIGIYFHKVDLIKSYRINNLLLAFYWFIKQLIKNRRDWSLKELLYVAAEMAVILNTLSYLEKRYETKVLSTKLICFDSTFGHDAILTAFFKKLNIPTYSLQHSFFYDFIEFFPEEIIKYDVNFPDFYLFWSQRQIDLVVGKFGASSINLINAGNPNVIRTDIPPIKQTFKRCLVLLSRFYYHIENIKLLKELSLVNGVEFYVRPHPSLKEIPEKINFDDYRKLCTEYSFVLDENNNSLNDVLSKSDFDFTICFNTAAYFDSLINGLICFRYSYNENEYFEGLDDRFNDHSKLLEKITFFKSFKEKELREQILIMLKKEIGFGSFRYKELI